MLLGAAGSSSAASGVWRTPAPALLRLQLYWGLPGVREADGPRGAQGAREQSRRGPPHARLLGERGPRTANGSGFSREAGNRDPPVKGHPGTSTADLGGLEDAGGNTAGPRGSIRGSTPPAAPPPAPRARAALAPGPAQGVQGARVPPTLNRSSSVLPFWLHSLLSGTPSPGLMQVPHSPPKGHVQGVLQPGPQQPTAPTAAASPSK
ncbi:hypothetical protein VULLAG_LOCUS9188 [Vulpes lagopus]